ncbi:MAG: hypothetical protein BGP04_05595 [Rhizobiales bacterium 62-17]|nr:hypothetical protein [Hyphomicrobiales bacterium]OJY02791.1 MAG: hypothetical protein BGP04_05595 [Rhizobiales bacterium 62-17]
MKTYFFPLPVFVAAATMASSAWAGGCAGGHCYQRVTTPPVYDTVQEQVMVSPPRAVAREIPAEYGEVTEQVMTRAPRTYARQIPPVTQTVAERVMVQPARKVWSVTRDAYGREVGCWVMQPATYATQYRQVVVQPGGVTYETQPAEYATVTRPVQVRAARTYYESIPATYATQSRQVMVQPGYDGWQPIGGGHHRPRKYLNW